ncbi:hypothetical protein WA026_016208 [Henosepilachna vigintioctopunctata]|uniref:Uncharacterized protein n=1 Tax=Henosepilachna vigintioctopunctata TaxID=420089 RepID=A0AAW1TUV5_9CUCU
MNFTMKSIHQKIIPKCMYFIERSSHCSSMAQKLKCCGLIPEVIDQPPCERLRVNYQRVEVDLGNELLPIDCKDEPTVKWCTIPEKLYTLVMLDPDFPCRVTPSCRSWLHWLVGNIPGDDIEKGKTIAGYVGPAPPKKTGHHRFAFFVYQQCCEMKFSEKLISSCTAKGRPNFDLSCFAQKYNLGVPKAGNFFKAEFDCYVETLHRQIGLK